MTLLATIRHKKGYVVASDALLTHDGYTSRSGLKFKAYDDAVIGMCGDVAPWPSSTTREVLEEASGEGKSVGIISVSDAGVHHYQEGTSYEVIDDFSVMGSGAACGVTALRLYEKQIRKAKTLPEVEVLIKECLSVAVEHAEGCGNPIHTFSFSFK